jgi:hypothetical protein
MWWMRWANQALQDLMIPLEAGGDQQAITILSLLALDKMLAVATSMPQLAYDNDLEPKPDPDDDDDVLNFLRTGDLSDDLSDLQKLQIRRTVRSYVWKIDTLLRVLPNGLPRIVPPPGERKGLVEKTHELSGHFGQAHL